MPESNSNMDKEIIIDVGRIFRELMKKLYIIIICTVLCGVAAYLYSMDIKDPYYAQSSISCYSTNGNYKEDLSYIYAVQTYIDVINSSRVSERASVLLNGELNAAQVKGSISVSYTDDSPTIRIRAISIDAQQAVRVANAVAESVVIEAQNLTGSSNINILDRASSAYMSGRSSKAKYTLIGLGAGFLIPVAIIVLLQIFSDKIYYVDDASLNGKIEILGVIPKNDKM